MFIREKIMQKNRNYHQYPSPTIVFLGDSITHGCFELYEGKDKNIEVNFDFEAVYHSQFRKMINNFFPYASLNIINSGISGDTAQNGWLRLERDVLKFNPDLVVICYGLNDSNKGKEGLDEYIGSLFNVFSVLKKDKIEVIFMTPNMKNTYISPTLKGDKIIEMAKFNMESQMSGIFDLYIENAKDLCEKEDIVICDGYDKWKKLYEIGVDTTCLLANLINHPTREMHKLFAWLLFETIIF